MRRIPSMVFLFLTAWLGVSCLHGQVSTREPLAAETQLVLHMQSLEQTWEVQQARTAQARQGGAPEIGPLPADAELHQQLIAIQGPEMRFGLFPRVRAFISLYASQQKESLEAVLGMSAVYHPVIDRTLAQMKLPQNLRYLPMALSAMNICAVSNSGAAGLWQMQYHAALRYGLICSQEVDERRDLHRSTRAALTQLNDLYTLSGDWILAITAYTCGPAGLNRARQRAGGSTDFQALYPHLPAYGRDYVPAFVAACYISHFGPSMGVAKLEVANAGMPDRIQLQEPLGFKSVAKVLQIPEEQLRALNPVCRMEMIPGMNAPIQLCLPRGYGAKFSTLRDSIYKVHADFQKKEELQNALQPKPDVALDTEPETGEDPAEGPAVSSEEEGRAPVWTPPHGTVPLKYTIKAGDNLGTIAQMFGVGLSDLMAANRLSTHRIRAGDQLTIYVPKSKAKEWEHTNSIPPQPNGSVPNQLPKPERAPEQGNYEIYTVKQGDTLWEISRRFPGVTDKDIMRINGITENIQPGMRLKIPRNPK